MRYSKEKSLLSHFARNNKKCTKNKIFSKRLHQILYPLAEYRISGENSDGIVIYKTRVVFVALCKITIIILLFYIVQNMEVRKLYDFSTGEGIFNCVKEIIISTYCAKVFKLLLYLVCE